ncbi:MAG: glycosyltransferase [Candidatus Komeilibacteria bacterium]|nr:glycosyltransferase [Candidatus Komeilibacteria bacterium]
MKLIYLSNSRQPTEKAHGWQIAKMCEQFAGLGLEVALVFPVRKNPIKENLFTYYNLKPNFKLRPIKLPDFIALEKYIGPVGFYLQSFAFFSKLLFLKIDKNAVIYSRQPELVWLFNLKGYLTVYEAHRWPGRFAGLLKFLLDRKNIIVANSIGTAGQFLKNGYKNVLTAPNGVDLSSFEINSSLLQLRQELNLPLGKKIVMYLGHLYGWKGIATLLKAAEELKDNQEILFVIVGGTDRDLNFFQRQVQLPNILFVGYKDKKDVPKWLKSADLLLLTLNQEDEQAKFYTSPMKLFEYLAAKVPVVVPALPSIKNLVSEKEVVFYQADSAVDLVQKIRQSLHDDLNEKIIQGGELVKKHTWQARAAKIYEYFKNYVK